MTNRDAWLDDPRQVIVSNLRQAYYQVPAEVWEGLERRFAKGDRAAQELETLRLEMKQLCEAHPELVRKPYDGRNHMNRPPPESDG